MKRVGLYVLLALLVLSVTSFFASCSGGGGGGGGSSTSSSGGNIQNTPATQQASTGTQAANMGTGSATLFDQFGLSQTVGAPRIKMGAKTINDPVLAKASKFAAKFAKAKSVTAALKKSKILSAVSTTGTVTCTDGGTISFAGTSTSVTMSFATCREDGTEISGDAAIAVNGSIYNESLGTSNARLTMLSFSDNTYSVMVSQLSSAVTLSMSGTATTAGMSADGDIAITDYTTGGDVFTLAFNQTTYGFSETTDTGTGAVTDVTTLGGGVTETWTPAGGSLHSFAVAFTSFTAADVYASAGAAAYDESLSGGIDITMNPPDCGDGSYVFNTITPVHYDDNGITQSGQITISATKNATTTVVRITYLTNGLVTIEVQENGNFVVVQSNVDPYDLANLCGVETPNEPAPSSSGSSGTTGNAALTATLSWDGPINNNDMDLHLVHLTSAPTTTSFYGTDFISDTGIVTDGANTDWHLYWGTGPGGACSTLERYIGYDSNNKIASLDVDNCDGLGPEHITMGAPLPTGYYVFYVDPFAVSDPPITVTVTLQVGNQLFTAPTHQFTSSADSVYRAFDVTVDASGNVTVMQPNTNITVLDSPTMRAPKL
jgi:hypothetical protein